MLCSVLQCKLISFVNLAVCVCVCDFNNTAEHPAVYVRFYNTTRFAAIELDIQAMYVRFYKTAWFPAITLDIQVLYVRFNNTAEHLPAI